MVAGQPCAGCEEQDRRRYAAPVSELPNLMTVWCPGFGKMPRHPVLAIAIGPNGLCKRCEPPEPASPKPAGVVAVGTTRPTLEVGSVSALAPPPVVASSHQLSPPCPVEIKIAPRPIVTTPPRRELDEWLYALLWGHGAVLVVEIQSEAVARGYSWPRVKRSKERLMIESEKLEWSQGWAWHLPFPD